MSADPRENQNENDDLADEVPGFQQADWDEIQSGIITREDVPPEEIYEGEPLDGELPCEDDDNPYMDSDEALPDDAEERAISRNPSKEGGTFDEV